MVIQDFKNRHIGQDVVIMGSGPSLHGANVDILSRCLTVGYNAAFVLQSPTYYTTADPTFPKFNQARLQARATGVPFFMCPKWKKCRPYTENEIEVPGMRGGVKNLAEVLTKGGPLESHFRSLFNDESLIEKGISSVVSGVPELAMPLAFYMGFDRIFLIGVDFTPKSNSPPTTTILMEHRNNFINMIGSFGINWADSGIVSAGSWICGWKVTRLTVSSTLRRRACYPSHEETGNQLDVLEQIKKGRYPKVPTL